MLALTLVPAPILPSDPRIVYVGRFDRHAKDAATCQWSASEVRLRVAGTTLKATVEEKGTDFSEVVVDGRPLAPLALRAGTDTYILDLGSKAEHEVRLVKRTEPFVGTTTFHGFETPDGRMLRAAPRKRHLEFVGDSITCGFGNEGKDRSERFSPATENAYLSYASIAARNVGADATLIAWSGRKMWPDNTTPEVYDEILPNGGPKWGFKGPAPDAVVINLATNDFARENPDEKGWTDAYEAFVRRVWSHYPKARVYATIGSMMTDTFPTGHQALSTLRGYLNRMVARMNDPRLRLLEFDPQRPEDGYGAAWHPNVTTDTKMAARLTEALKHDLKG